MVSVSAAYTVASKVLRDGDIRFGLDFNTGSFRGIAVPKTSAGLQSEGWLDGMMQQAWSRIVPERKNSETRSETQGPIHV